jgi:mono/diheme cytochrome c family protein
MSSTERKTMTDTSPNAPPRAARRACWVSAALLSIIPAVAFAADKPANMARGRQLYMATGCYQCHGTRGEGGGNAGPRLAPGPLPLEGFTLQLRHPRARMPVYTAVVMPDGDVADIYAYLLTVPKGKTAAEIPMLKSLATGPSSK